MEIRTIHADSFYEFKGEVENYLKDGFIPNVAIVFASVTLDLPLIIQFLREKELQIFGCSSCGEFIYDNKSQNISEGGIVCSLMRMKPGTFKIKSFSRNDMDSHALGAQVGNWIAETFNKPAVMITASGLDVDGEQIVRGIQEVAGEDLIMFGGLAGDDAKFENTYTFADQGLDPAGAVVLVLDTEYYDIRGLATSGWVGIGADKIVTHSEGNVVYTIDGEPALDIYTTYLNVSDSDLPEIGVEYPLLVKKPDSPDVLRAVLNVDRAQKALIFAGSMPTGSVVTFSSSPGFEIIESTRQKVNEFHQQNFDTDLLVLYSCMARHNALGPTISEEIDQVWQNWHKPLIGFFTYGEIGSNYNAACDFHNETFTMVSIREKQNG